MSTRMLRTGGYATGAVLMALLLAGCPSNDVDGDDLADALEEAGATTEQANCAAGRFDEELTQEQRNQVAGADDQEAIDNLNDEVRTTYESIMTECLVGEGETTETTAEGAEGEETTTTAADDATTTSAAG
jgi:hypothetical protein